jgi:6-pyruvoyltetrahydropterin/6-carboxytetrahydropterin synthase
MPHTTTITRRLEFDAAHRVLNHESKCAKLHGHRYRAEVTVEAPHGLDSIGRVIDFSQVKLLVGEWIDTHWDHGTLLHGDDPLLPSLKEHGQKLWIMTGRNPTAEEMAKELFQVAQQLLDIHSIVVRRVRLYETPNCWADFFQ